MNKTGKASEPSMDEILASIRKIIAEEPSTARPAPTGGTRRPEPFGSDVARRPSPALAAAAPARTPIPLDADLGDLIDEPAAAGTSEPVLPSPKSIAAAPAPLGRQLADAPPTVEPLVPEPVLKRPVDRPVGRPLERAAERATPAAEKPHVTEAPPAEAKPAAADLSGFVPRREPAPAADGASAPTVRAVPDFAAQPTPKPASPTIANGVARPGAQVQAPASPEPLDAELAAPLASFSASLASQNGRPDKNAKPIVAPVAKAVEAEAASSDAATKTTHEPIGGSGPETAASASPPIAASPVARPAPAPVTAKPAPAVTPMAQPSVAPAAPAPVAGPAAAPASPAAPVSAAASPAGPAKPASAPIQPLAPTAAAPQAAMPAAQPAPQGPSPVAAAPVVQATAVSPINPALLPAAATRTLEDTVAELLRPMLRQWLDANMPRIVEKALRVELAQMAPKTVVVQKPRTDN